MASMLRDWFTRARWRLSFGHCLLGIPFFCVGYAVGGPDAAALAVGAAFYMREVTQHQTKVKALGASNITAAHRGWWPGEWDTWSRIDFAAPLILALLASTTI